MRTIRLNLDSQHPDQKPSGKDELTKLPPAGWRGNATLFQIGAFYNDVPRDLTGYTAFELVIRPTQILPQNLAYATAAAPESNTITKDAWVAGNGQHVSFLLSDSQLNITTNNEPKRQLWLSVTARDSSGHETTLGTSYFYLAEDNNTAAPPAPENPGAALTEAQLNGLLTAKTGIKAAWTPNGSLPNSANTVPPVPANYNPAGTIDSFTVAANGTVGTVNYFKGQVIRWSSQLSVYVTGEWLAQQHATVLPNKADLVGGKLKADQVPALPNKADLVGGKLKADQVPSNLATLDAAQTHTAIQTHTEDIKVLNNPTHKHALLPRRALDDIYGVSRSMRVEVPPNSEGEISFDLASINVEPPLANEVMAVRISVVSNTVGAAASFREMFATIGFQSTGAAYFLGFVGELFNASAANAPFTIGDQITQSGGKVRLGLNNSHGTYTGVFNALINIRPTK